MHVPIFFTRHTFAYRLFDVNTLPSEIERCFSNSAMFVQLGCVGVAESWIIGEADGSTSSVGEGVGDGI